MSLKDARVVADVIFRGRITALRDSRDPSELGGLVPDPHSGFVKVTNKIAVFSVTRVWKGDVGRTFEMPAFEEASSCYGFWPRLLAVGNELLVYALRLPTGQNRYMYLTGICSRTHLTRETRDFDELGLGYEPGRSPESIKQRKFLALAIVFGGLLSLGSYLFQKRASARAGSWSSLR
jgi:hypothetical protein